MANQKKESVTELLARAAKLQAEMDAMQAEVAKARETKVEEIKESLADLPEAFGLPNKTQEEIVSSLGMIEGYIHSFRKGTLGKLITNGTAGNKTYKRLSDEEKKKITQSLRDGKTVSELATQYGVSAPTVWGLKKAAGLTKERESAAAKK